ncbi:antibiotic biosynthesis monooxygenase [Pseudomonas sp. BN414]|uniref:putative quinol monooxygenase n=1 Tax=unclassified Pseudomonas TaxID=196821 RepID=UPI0024545F90|nr:MULTISPECIES: putative quinol monooxygenase [unclassified Pseudomonas]MDH4560485.1 antibiotic biosynthesis monooxygenase [Pseudomonas sp. BN411]MDH4566663.1 antibiotic biosynthesis monooxygenase [Pseudomonas sp. BN414]
MSFPLYVMAYFRVRPEAVSEMLELLRELSTLTRGEPGCLEYAYYQSTEDALEFCSFEVWKTAGDEAAHWQTEHLLQALKKAEPLLQSVPHIIRSTRVT